MTVDLEFSNPPDVHIIATYGEVTLSPTDATPKSNHLDLWELIPNVFATFRSITLNLLFLGFLATVGTLTYQALTRSPTVIEAFAVPPQLAEQGLTGAVIAHKLWDEIAHIQEDSGTIKTQVSLLPEVRQFDIVEPDSGISFLSLANMVRALLNRPQRAIGGEVTCKTSDCSGQALHLTVRLLDRGRAVLIDGPLDLSKDEPAFRSQALVVLEAIDPYSVAAYYYGAGADIGRAERIARKLYFARTPQADWAANLLGNIAFDDGDLLLAIEWYEKAIEIDPDLTLPWNGWGLSLGNLERHEEAVEKYQRAIEIDPDLTLPWNNWGYSLGQLERYDEAFERYLTALKISPNHGSAANNWRIDLSRALRPTDTDRCAMANVQIPKFLEHASELVSSQRLTEFKKILAECS